MTRIEWAHHAHNVVSGCSPASPGCDNCYAAFLSDGRLKHHSCALPDGARGRRADLVRLGKRRDDPSKHRRIYNGKVALDVPRLRKALKIPRNGGKKGPRVFWNHLSDTFHEGLSFAEIAAQFAVMAARPDLKFMVLTKRPERAQAFFAWLHTSVHFGEAVGCGQYLAQTYFEVVGDPLGCGRHASYSDMLQHAGSWPLSNFALGVSAEDQPRWDSRVSVLRELPAAVRFVSVEPMLGPIDPVIRGSRVSGWDEDWVVDPLTGFEGASPRDDSDDGPRIDQVIIGAESGPGARPMDLRWAQDLARAVLDARGPALFFKQGNVCPGCAGEGKYRMAGRTMALGCVDCGGFGAELTGTLRPGHGTGAKVRKDCPELYIPGHGTQSWAQFPEGWQ